MSKFLLILVGLFTVTSVFAEAYSTTKMRELIKSGNYKDMTKYAYESQVSNDTGWAHIDNAIAYFIRCVKNCDASVQQIEQQIAKFKDKIGKKTMDRIRIKYYSWCGHDKEAANILKNYETEYDYASDYYFYRYVNVRDVKHDKNLTWQYGKQLLLMDGGFNNPVSANIAINRIFRYKPESVTKEQQIEFLSKLADIYPIPGTDFNQWKNFMGFVGFKYKQLTKKQLF